MSVHVHDLSGSLKRRHGSGQPHAPNGIFQSTSADEGAANLPNAADASGGCFFAHVVAFTEAFLSVEMQGFDLVA